MIRRRLRYPGRLDKALKERQWPEVMDLVYTKASVRSLSWFLPLRTFGLAVYTKLPKYLASPIARLQLGGNNSTVYRAAREHICWNQRRCNTCNKVETETHVVCHGLRGVCAGTGGVYGRGDGGTSGVQGVRC